MAKVKIGNKEFEIKKFYLNDIIKITEVIGDIRDIPKKEFLDQLKAIRHILWYALHKMEGDLTEEQVGDMIAVSDVNKLTADIMKATDVAGNPIVAQKK